MLLQIILVLLSVLLTGCASQQVQQQMLTQQAANTESLESQKSLLNTQQQSLDLLLAQQNQLQEVLELNQLQLQKLINIANKPKVKKVITVKEVAVKKPLLNTEPEVPAPQKMTLGRVELLWVDRLQDYLKARIDTGAKSSSIHASDIQYFERDGKQWVRFNMFTHKRITPTDDANPKDLIFEAPVIRTVKIKQASASSLDKRPVISLRVRIGDYEDDAQFTLTSRKGMLYPVLIGRGFLQDVAVVDVGQVFLHKRKKN